MLLCILIVDLAVQVKQAGLEIHASLLCHTSCSWPLISRRPILLLSQLKSASLAGTQLLANLSVLGKLDNITIVGPDGKRHSEKDLVSNLHHLQSSLKLLALEQNMPRFANGDVALQELHLGNGPEMRDSKMQTLSMP